MRFDVMDSEHRIMMRADCSYNNEFTFFHHALSRFHRVLYSLVESVRQTPTKHCLLVFDSMTVRDRPGRLTTVTMADQTLGTMTLMKSESPCANSV